MLPSFFPSLMKELRSHGLVMTLVGGAVRDFLREEKLGKDWDIELSHASLAFTLEGWKNIGRSLQKMGKVTYLPFEVIRLTVGQHEIEFSPPRREIFHDHLADKGHKNFEVVLDFGLPFELAVQRRDFTINAMGMRFHDEEIEFLDPLEGLRHLRENLLHPAGPNFSRDPVRFLRALRFALKYKMDMSPELKVQLQTMKVDNFSSTYLWSEMKKSQDPLGFCRLILWWSQFHPHLKLPFNEGLQIHHGELARVLEDPLQQESWVIALEWVGLSSEEWQKYFSLSSDSCQRLARWARSSKEFQKIYPENFQGEFDVVRETREFALLFDWYFTTKQVMQKNPRLPLLKMIDDYLPHWVHLFKFGPLKDVKHIDPPLRAKYQVWNICQRL
jgi:tRNA nucleotidyltransferase/poly(A) polymerase